MKYKDSAPEKWEYSEHTRIKHEILEKYLYIWIIKLGKFHRKILFFDCFAGRGEYTDKAGNVVSLGSPIIAFQVADRLLRQCEKKKHKPYFDKFICTAVEKDKTNFENLQKVITCEKTKLKFKNKIEIKLENDKFANVANEILERVGKNIAPSFFFIDPFGFSGVPFKIVSNILSLPHTEIFFTFMAQSINRFLAASNVEEALNKLYPTPEWKQILGNYTGRKREEALTNLYIKCLHENTEVKYTWAFKVSMDEKYRTLYYLIHATNHIDGHKLMKYIMSQQGIDDSFAYLGPEDLVERNQMRLFDVKNIEQLKELLLKKFNGKKLTYDNIQEKICFPWHEEPPYTDQDYRKVLKELEKEGKIQVRRVSSKKTGLKKDDKIVFSKNVLSGKDSSTSMASISKGSPKIKVYYKEYELLSGKKKSLVWKVNDGSIITRFDRTPVPIKEIDVVCPHFLELKWAYGCPFDCAWCYLNGTFRFRLEGKSPVIKSYNKVRLHTERFLEEAKEPEILNTGEIADSLMNEDSEVPFSKFIVPLFEKQSLHKVLFLTKSPDIKHLLELKSHNQVIISFSLNAIPVAERWEEAPHVLKRIEAAKKLFNAGYEVRVRIDPMVPVENWEKYYSQLLKIIFRNFTPERITLGSLRGLQSTINNSPDKTWVKYLSETSNWGKKVDFKTRYAMYSVLIKELQNIYKFNRISLCKETVRMWEKLEMDYKKIRCNCIW